MLGVQQNSKELEDVCKCSLLCRNPGLGDIETVSMHQVTRIALKESYMKNTSACKDPLVLSVSNVAIYKHQSKYIVVESSQVPFAKTL